MDNKSSFNFKTPQFIYNIFDEAINRAVRECVNTVSEQLNKPPEEISLTHNTVLDRLEVGRNGCLLGTLDIDRVYDAIDQINKVVVTFKPI